MSKQVLIGGSKESEEIILDMLAYAQKLEQQLKEANEVINSISEDVTKFESIEILIDIYKKKWSEKYRLGN